MDGGERNDVLVASTRPELGHLLLSKLGGKAAAEAAGVEGGCRYSLALRTRYYAATLRLLLVDAPRASEALALLPHSPQLSVLFVCSDIREWRERRETAAAAFAAVGEGVRVAVLTTATADEEEEEELARWCLAHQAEAAHFRFTDELPSGPSASLLAEPSGLEAVMNALQCVRWAVEEREEEANGASETTQESESGRVRARESERVRESERGESAGGEVDPSVVGERETVESQEEEGEEEEEEEEEEEATGGVEEPPHSGPEASPPPGEGARGGVEELLARLPDHMDDAGLEAAFSSLQAITSEVRSLPDDQRTNAAAAVALRLAMLLGEDGEDF